VNLATVGSGEWHVRFIYQRFKLSGPVSVYWDFGLPFVGGSFWL